jgi:hypothetical protein
MDFFFEFKMFMFFFLYREIDNQVSVAKNFIANPENNVYNKSEIRI